MSTPIVGLLAGMALGLAAAIGGFGAFLLVAALGHDAILPLVLGPDESAGRTSAGVLVGSGAGDNAGAALGLSAGPGDVVVSIGTSGTVFSVSDSPVRDSSGTVAGFADAAGRFLPLSATLNAARVVDTVASVLGVDFDEHIAFVVAALEEHTDELELHGRDAASTG